MAEYRYVVFPRGKQPTVEEVNEFRNYAVALEKRFAIGLSRGDSRLAIAFDADIFQRTLSSYAGFETLIRHWQRRGCSLVDHLKFVKDPSALRPVDNQPVNPIFTRSREEPGSQDRRITAKERIAKEALGRSMLQFHKTLERYRAIERFAAWGPYLMIACASLITIGLGFYIADRIEDSGTEQRTITTTRVVEDPMQQPLQVAEKPEADSETEAD